MAGDWIKALKPASFRGVPFGVKTEESKHGRRLAVQEYVKRDKPYAEDMGRLTRTIGFSGFLISDSLVYGGGDVMAQREKLVAAAEAKGPGKLVHPILGDLTVSCFDVTILSRWDEQHYFEIQFRFVESGDRLYPTAAPATAKAVEAKGMEARLRAAEAWSRKAAAAMARGAVTVQKAVATARQWTDRITSLGQDATGMFRLTGALAGSFGRYFRGRLTGGFSNLLSLTQPLTSIEALIGAGGTQRALLALRGDDVLDALQALGQGGTLQDVADAVAAQVETLAGLALDPADRVRLLLDLGGFTVTGDLAATPIGLTLSDLYRQSAVVALSAAAAAYQPASFDDAATVLGQLVAAIDLEITRAGDAGDDGVFTALRGQRAAVVQDLRSRGADLAPIADFAIGAPMPSLALAQRLYRDAGRDAELVTQASPVHPLFMPARFRALAL